MAIEDQRGEDAQYCAPLTLPDEAVYYTPRTTIPGFDQGSGDIVYVIGHGRTHLGRTWSALQQLMSLEQDAARVHRIHLLEPDWVRLEPDREAQEPGYVERLIRQGLDTVPDSGFCADLLNRFRPPLEVMSEAPNPFGAYSLSAGFPVPPQIVVAAAFEALVDTFNVTQVRTYAELVELVAVWLIDLSRLLQRLLTSPAYEYTNHVPPHACSPCGVIRMASPEIPRGPQVGLHLDAPVRSWALAA
ncbi:hypothetical protein [Streptomyces sp. NPDC002082]|uniref:hypothetical protein n=1 Tax=Streptomyces sp. NPDC002082 TaxID=3154772 RepID=UPI0033315A91